MPCAKLWRRIARNYLHGEQSATLLVTRFFASLYPYNLPVRYLIFPFFFPRFAGSARLYSATQTTMNTRCGTWIHLVFAWRRSSPLINFWEPALGRYVCTTPTPITDMETTFRSTGQHHGWCPYIRPPRKVIRRPAARVNSDEKSRRNTRAGNWLGDRTIPARDRKIFNSAQLLKKKVGQRAFLTWKYASAWKYAAIGKHQFLKIEFRGYCKYLQCREEGERPRKCLSLEKTSLSSSQKRDYITINFHNTRHARSHTHGRTTKNRFYARSGKIRGLGGTLNSKLSGRKRKETGWETSREKGVREREREGERGRERGNEGKESSCTQAETFSNYKRRHSRAGRQRLFLKQEYSSPPRDIMRKREARSEGAIMAAVMKKSTHPGTQPPPSHPAGEPRR